MSSTVHFETPENIEIAYEPAGLGSRFSAWVLDSFLVGLFCFLLTIGLLVVGVASTIVEHELKPVGRNLQPGEIPQFSLYMLGVIWLIWGFGSFLYFALSELLFKGQTLGKRKLSVRVVKADGFALDARSVLLRNIFRLVDQLPPLWLVPLVSKRSQRLGDMAAGTIVVAERAETLSQVRSIVAGRPKAQRKFHFTPAALKRARPQDIEAVERVLERWMELEELERDMLFDRLVPSLAERLQVEQPYPHERLSFLEDFMAYAHEFQHRALG